MKKIINDFHNKLKIKKIENNQKLLTLELL